MKRESREDFVLSPPVVQANTKVAFKRNQIQINCCSGKVAGKVIVMQQQYDVKIRPTYRLTNSLKDKARDAEWKDQKQGMNLSR